MPEITFESSSQFAEVNGARLHFNRAGSGHPLLTFHGGGPGANGWDNCKWNIDALSQHFDTMLIDLPGYGYSENSEAHAGETQDVFYARIILEFLDKMGFEKAHLYGTSMSGAPVLRFAIDHPERVAKLVLKSPSGVGPNILSTSPPDGIMALNAFRDDPSRENMVKMMRLFVPGKGLLTEEMIEARYQSALRAMAMTPVKVRATGSSEMRPSLPTLRMPALVIWGHQDRMVPMDGALSALAMIPNARVHLWGGGTGHFIEYEHPAEFSALVTNFLLADWDGRTLS